MKLFCYECGTGYGIVFWLHYSQEGRAMEQHELLAAFAERFWKLDIVSYID
jgi:hypothetical protein